MIKLFDACRAPNNVKPTLTDGGTIKLREHQCVEVVKGFGIVMVVAGHTFEAPTLIRMIYLFHMPLFFFLSGAMFTKARSPIIYSVAKVKTLLIPWVIALVAVLVGNLIPGTNGEGGLWGSSGLQGALSAFWFIPVLYLCQQSFNVTVLAGRYWPFAAALVCALIVYCPIDFDYPGVGFLRKTAFAFVFFLLGNLCKRVGFTVGTVVFALGLAVTGLVFSVYIPSLAVDMAANKFGLLGITFVISLSLIFVLTEVAYNVSLRPGVVRSVFAFIGSGAMWVYLMHQPLNVFLCTHGLFEAGYVLFFTCLFLPLVVRDLTRRLSPLTPHPV